METLKKIKEEKFESITRLEIYNLKKSEILDILDNKGIDYKKSWRKEKLLETTGILELLRPHWEKFDLYFAEKNKKKIKTIIEMEKFEKENDVKGTITLSNGDTRSATRVTDYYCSYMLDAWVISYGGDKWIYIEGNKKMFQVTK